MECVDTLLLRPMVIRFSYLLRDVWKKNDSETIMPGGTIGLVWYLSQIM